MNQQGSPPGNKRGIFRGLCPLCGARSTGAYCYAHAWAGGGPLEPPAEMPLLKLIAESGKT